VEGGVAAAAREVDHRAAPFGGALEVGQPVAGDQGGAAGVADRERIGGLAAGGRRHRLVEQRHAAGEVPGVHARKAQLRERGRLQVGVAQLAPEGGGALSVLVPAGGIARGALGVLDLEPAARRARSRVLQQPLGPREPPARGGRLAGDPVLAREVRGEVRRLEGGAAALVFRIGLTPTLDPRLRVAQPPQRSP
jgi:hypothetical protein